MNIEKAMEMLGKKFIFTAQDTDPVMTNPSMPGKDWLGNAKKAGVDHPPPM